MGKPRKIGRERSNSLRSSRLTIGVLLGDIDPYSLRVWSGIADVARREDVNLISFVGRVLRERRDVLTRSNLIYELANAQNVDGLVISTAVIGSYISREVLRDFYQRYAPLPMVSIGETLENIPSIVVDNDKGMHDLMVHLIVDHGYRQIACFKGPDQNPDAMQRYQTYTETLAEYDIPLNPNLVVPCDFGIAQGMEAMSLLVDRPGIDFEAVVAANDDVALGALKVVQARGMRVSDAVAVVGFDDVQDSKYVVPPLTTVRQPIYELGRRAAEIVLAQLQGKEVPQQITLPTEMVVRQSCGCPSQAVRQARVENIIVTTTDDAAGKTFETLLSTQREHILYEIEQALHSPSAGYQSAISSEGTAQLLDTFLAELGGEASDIFLPALNKVLRQVIVTGGDITLWQDALSVLRRQMLPHLNDKGILTQAENLWQQARVLLAEMAQQAQVYQRLQTEQQAQALREINQALITTFDLPQLMDVIARELPRLGIKSCYLSLYETQPESSASVYLREWSRLVLAYNDTGRIELESDGRRFLSQQLVPAGMLPHKRRYAMLVMPLYRERQLGFVLFEMGLPEGFIYDALQGHISSALQSALLMQQVHQARERFQDIALSTFDWLWEVDAQGRYTYCSEQAVEVLGYPTRELIGQTLFDCLLAPEDVQLKTELDELMSGKQPLVELESQNRHKDGRLVWLLTSGVPIVNDDDYLLGYRGVTKNITNRKQAEESLKEAHAELEERVVARTVELEQEVAERKQVEEALAAAHTFRQAIIDGVAEPIMVISAGYQVKLMNRAARDFSTSSAGGAEPLYCYQVSHQSEAPCKGTDHPCPLEKVRQTGRPAMVVHQHYQLDGKLRFVEILASPLWGADGAFEGIIESSRDITERKQTEDALRKSEERHRSLTDDVLDSSAVGIIILDAGFRIVWVNQAWERYFGLRRDEVVGQDTRQFSRERIRSVVEDPETFIEKVFATYDNNTYKEKFECHILPNDERQERWLEHQSQPIRSGFYAGGRIEHYYGITERKRAEEILLQRGRQLQILSRASQQINAVLEIPIIMRMLVVAAMGLVRATSGMAGLFVRKEMIFTEYDQKGRIFPIDYKFKRGEGVTGLIIETKEPYISNEAEHDPHVIAEVQKDLGFYNLVNIPILSRQGELLGCFEIHNTQGHRLFDEYDISMLQGLAAGVAVALENAQMLAERTQAEEEIRRRNRELALLNRVIAASAADLGIESILEAVCRELTLVFNVFRATVALLNEEKTTATIIAEYPSTLLKSDPELAEAAGSSTGSIHRLAEDRSSMLNRSIPVASHPFFQYLFDHKAPLVVNDIQNDPRLTTTSLLMEGVEEGQHQGGTGSLLALPLIIENEVAGSLSLETVEPHQFSTQEINLAWSVADQTAGALARSRLTQTRQRLITAIEQAAENVVVTNTKGAIFYVNPAFEQTTGYSRAEVVGQNMRLLNSGQHEAAFYQKMRATLNAGQVWRGRFTNKKKDGTFYTAETTISPVRGEGGDIMNYVSVQRDVTHELQLEEQYHQAQRMEAVGQLAAGVAHDFNNILTAIIGYASLPLDLELLSPNHPVRDDLQGILQSANRATDLTRQLLTFARRQIIKPIVLNLNDLILDVDKMLRRLIGTDVELVTLPAPDLGRVKADPGQIEQVLLNLAVNARDAMPNGGKLIIETANVTLDQDYTRQYTDVEPGQYVMLTVSDTGVGMTEEVKSHIFEPFFTTKEASKGTGLGLATCFGIVKQSGGHIWVSSKLNQGTTFKIYLPRVVEVVDFLPRHDQFQSLPRGTETILLVEDEVLVRGLAGRTLRKQGYTVLEAANGEEALRVAQEQAEKEIDLLLTDVVMPQMGGKELADRLLALRPTIKLLLTSGYIDDTIIRDGVLETGIAFLQKPFSPVALARKVREVLDQ